MLTNYLVIDLRCLQELDESPKFSDYQREQEKNVQCKETSDHLLSEINKIIVNLLGFLQFFKNPTKIQRVFL